MIDIERVNSSYSVNYESLNKLLTQQSPSKKERTIDKTDLTLSLNNFNFHLFVVVDWEKSDQYLGMASIFFQRNLAGWKGEIHDVVVDEDARGLGLGEKLVRKLLETAQIFCAKQKIEMKLYLTSRPERVAANNLYKKLGFILVSESCGEWGTNLYKMIMGPTGPRGLS